MACCPLANVRSSGRCSFSPHTLTVLVIGHIPRRSHLGDNGNGYGIIVESHIPVLSV